MNVYDFKVRAMDGSEVDLSQYKGKVTLVVNTATGCGFTPQYEDLQKIYDEYKEQGFDILDFPCNQFADQAPGDDEEIHTFCTGRFGITFPQFSKVEVNGEGADPLWKYITSNTKFAGFDGAAKLMLAPIVKKMDKDYKNNGNIKWNFTKFLVDREGNIVERFEPTKDMAAVREAVAALL